MRPSGSDLRDALIGAVIEGTSKVRYHLVEVIGEGGQGWVYRAGMDRPDGLPLVIKVLRPESVHTEALQRFQREAEVLRRLGELPEPNPHIVRFYDTSTTQVGAFTLPFLAMELVDGQTFASVIRAHGGFGLPVARVRRLMRQVALALHAVHEQRIVHRDLKPSNILLTTLNDREIAKVTDFGLVKLPDLSTNLTVSVAGMSLGYAPPEQYEVGNARVGPRADVFSFASVLYEALCGTGAFPTQSGDSPLRVVARMLSGPRPSLTRVAATVPRELRERPDLTAALDRELARALSADPEVRHRSIRDLWEKIEPVLDEATRRAPAASVPDATMNVTFDGKAASPAVLAAPMPAWRTASQPLVAERLRSASIAADRHAIVAIGANGLYRFARGVWAALHSPSGFDARLARGLCRTPKGDLFIFGEGGFIMTLSRGGVAELTPLRDRDVVILAAHIDDQGMLLAGERMSQPVGVLIDLPVQGPSEVRTIEGTERLTSVTRLAGGAIVACGTRGALIEVSGGEARLIPWSRSGHLYAVTAALDGGAFVVGSGGHALRISPPPALPGISAPPSATLEVVQTTRDLLGVVIDDEGDAWAAGAEARLLHRRQSTWTRIPLLPSMNARVLGVVARSDGITVLMEDGTVIEGPPIRGSAPPDPPRERPSRVT